MPDTPACPRRVLGAARSHAGRAVPPSGPLRDILRSGAGMLRSDDVSAMSHRGFPLGGFA